jgi:hypothetical protein
MSDKTDKAAAPVEDAFVTSDLAVKAVLPSGTVPSGLSPTNSALYNVWLPQTFAGAVVSGYATPSLSGNGWAGTNNNGFVFQNDQYNTTNRGF